MLSFITLCPDILSVNRPTSVHIVIMPSVIMLSVVMPTVLAPKAEVQDGWHPSDIVLSQRLNERKIYWTKVLLQNSIATCKSYKTFILAAPK
jgi:hypothetical protein